MKEKWMNGDERKDQESCFWMEWQDCQKEMQNAMCESVYRFGGRQGALQGYHCTERTVKGLSQIS